MFIPTVAAMELCSRIMEEPCLVCCLINPRNLAVKILAQVRALFISLGDFRQLAPLPDTLRVNIQKDMEMDQLIRDGIPFEAYDHFKAKLKMTHYELCIFIGLKGHRKLKHGNGRLSFISSDRLYRLARVYALVVEVLEDEDRGREWLKKPQYGLGGRIPLEVATTEIGAKEVENLLGRIEYSVLS